MPKRELSETEKALRLEHWVERKVLAVVMRLDSSRRIPVVLSLASRLQAHRTDELRRGGQSLGPTPLGATRTIDARELAFAKATCDPGFDVGGEGGA